MDSDVAGSTCPTLCDDIELFVGVVLPSCGSTMTLSPLFMQC